VILLVLAGLWIVVLAPSAIKRLLANRPTESIDSFHEQLDLLERTGPKLVTPAFRLQSAESRPAAPAADSGLPCISSMPGRPNLVLLRPLQGDADDGDVVEDGTGNHYTRVATVSPGGEPRPSRADQVRADDRHRRTRAARRRRRDIVLFLAATAVICGLLGVVHSLRPLWIVAFISAVFLFTYVALVAYIQSLVAPPSANVELEHSSDRLGAWRAMATAGYPGAWDDEVAETEPATLYEDDEFEYTPRHAAAR